MNLCHNKTPGVFPHFVNSAAFIDTVAINLWGKRRTEVLDYVSTGKNRPIGGYGRAYARCIPGRNQRTENPMLFKYGRLVAYKNVSPYVVIVWAGGLPVTLADVTCIVDAFMQRGWRARMAWAELTSDTEGIPVDVFSKEVCTTARTIREFEDECGTTLCIGSPNSSWRFKIYRKTYDLVRCEFTLQSRFLRKHGVTRPQELSLLRTVDLWNHVCFRRVDQTDGYSLPAKSVLRGLGSAMVCRRQICRLRFY